MSKPYLNSDWDYFKASNLLSAERCAEIDREVEKRTKPLITSGGTVVENGYTLTFPDGKSFLYLVSNYTTIQHHQKDLIAALLTPEELTLLNDRASSERRADKEAHLLETATKVSDLDWKDGVWWGDDFYPSVEEALDDVVTNVGDANGEIPTYFWAAKSRVVIPSLDVSNVVENWIEDRGWEDMEIDDLDGVEELQVALDKFVEQNKGVVSFELDHNIVVVLSEKTLEELNAQLGEIDE